MSVFGYNSIQKLKLLGNGRKKGVSSQLMLQSSTPYFIGNLSFRCGRPKIINKRNKQIC